MRGVVVDEDLASGWDEAVVQVHRPRDEVHSRHGVTGEEATCAQRRLSVVRFAFNACPVRVEGVTLSSKLLEQASALDELLAGDPLFRVQLLEPAHRATDNGIALTPRRTMLF